MIVDIIQEIDAESFPVILRYIYTGVADLSTLDAQDIRSMKCISVKTPIFAFNNQNQQALHFGTSDLIINGKTGTCIVKDFQNPIINTRNFNIDNIEVFAVRMKPSYPFSFLGSCLSRDSFDSFFLLEDQTKDKTRKTPKMIIHK
ncbi:18326_t:CDS:2 [Rhizophagus irregularis]|nr:18326_t:CDS:2 [Rhizophagus irregularis]